MEIIKLTKQAEIEETLKNASENLSLITQEILNLEVTPESKKTAKKKVAEMTKLFNELETQRKEVKKVYMQPYDEMLVKYKELIEMPYKKAKIEIGDRIAFIENVEKEEKEDEIYTYFLSLKVSKNLDFLEFENLNIKVGLSNSIKSLKDKILDNVIKIEKDLKAISNLEYKDEISVYYKQTLDLNDSIQKVMFLKSEAKREEEERIANQIKQEEEKERIAKITKELKIEPLVIEKPEPELEAENTNHSIHNLIDEILDVECETKNKYDFSIVCSIQKAKLIKKILKELGVI